MTDGPKNFFAQRYADPRAILDTLILEADLLADSWRYLNDQNQALTDEIGRLRNPMPTVETVPGFEMTYREDFDTDVPLGGFVNVNRGSDRGLLDPTSAGGQAYGKSIKTKAEGTPTSGSPESRYSTRRTLSVKDSVCTLWMHYEDGVPWGGGIKPIPPAPNHIEQLYGVYRYRLRLRGTGPGWGMVVDLIHPDTWKLGTGEYGHPEMETGSAKINSFIRPSDHIFNPNREINGRRIYPYPRSPDDIAGRQFPVSQFYTYTIIWQPGRFQLLVDDVVIWDDTKTPPTDPMRFVMQAARTVSWAANTEAWIDLDWCTISQYVGT